MSLSILLPEKEANDPNNNNDAKSIITRAFAFADLVSYIEMQKNQDQHDAPPVFGIIHLAHLHASRLEKLGIPSCDTRVQETRLKE